VHNIGSISKPIALIAVMQLVEQGKVKLDAEIQTYAPWFPRKERPITVRHLLTHTSGIRHYKDNELSAENINLFRHYAQFEESTRFWRDDPLVFPPGTKWLYSSYGSNLMQAIVESASGQPFETYLLENVWRPAGMLNTQLDVTPRVVLRRGKGYRRNPKTGALENAVNEDVSYKYAGGGMLSTDEDLCRFGHALNTGVLLKPQTLAEVYRPQLPPELQAPKQGLIFQIGRDAAGRAYAGQ
jgi:CubicO group peptidase (beta-lactamase class C family)